MRVHLTLRSSNKKTGPIPVSTTSAETCPPSCPFRSGGCYAKSWPLALHWDKVTYEGRGMKWGEFCAAIDELPKGQLWRHNQAGDLPGVEEDIDLEKLRMLVRANEGKHGFTYTHKFGNLGLVRWANTMGFTINLSGNSLAHADELMRTKAGPVVTVLPEDVVKWQGARFNSPAGHKVVVCPATYKDGVTCQSCKMCAKEDRQFIIGFPAHGRSKRRVTAIANG